MRRPTPGKLWRLVATLVFGIAPTTTIMIVVSWAVAQGDIGVHGPVELGRILFGLLGTIGLWRVALQDQFVGRFNFYCLAAGLVSILPLFLMAVAQGFTGLLHDGFIVVIVVIGPVVTAFAYLVAMVWLRRREKGTSADSVNAS